MKAIAEWHGVTPRSFRDEIQPLGRPAVLRGAVRDWPAVRRGERSPEDLASYLKGFDQEKPVEALYGPPEIDGRLFYREDMRGLNFTKSQQSIAAVLDKLIALGDEPAPPALAVQSAVIAQILPGFDEQNRLALLDAPVPPRIWIGNSVQVAAHFDLFDNVACVVAGRRHFTLFPPEQLPNLYVGPFDFSPAGAPVSMVPPGEPDFGRYPRYRDALACAEFGELQPGDAIYIPYMWWHAVTSQGTLNVLVNYWWNDHRPRAGSPFDALMHAFMVFGAMPEEHRRIWRRMLDVYAFRLDGDPLAHLPPEHRGALGGLDAAGAAAMRNYLARALARR